MIRLTKSLAITCITSHFVLSLQGATPVVQSVSPSKLIQAFPVVPADWKCLESKGTTDTSVMGVPITTGVRKYELPAEQDQTANDSEKTEKTRSTIRISAMDGGSQQRDSLRLRGASEAEGFGVPPLVGRIRSFPSRILFEAFGENRLMVQVEARGMTEDRFRRVLKAMNFEELAALERQFPKTEIATERQTSLRDGTEKTMLVRKNQNVIFDELHPERNRTWESSVADEVP